MYNTSLPTNTSVYLDKPVKMTILKTGPYLLHCKYRHQHYFHFSAFSITSLNYWDRTANLECNKRNIFFI